MSQMATVPVFACRICGKPVYVSYLSTTREDADNSLLKTLMQGLSKIALCQWHTEVRNWYASQGREGEFYLNPDIVLYNVRDNTGLDYYGRQG